MPVSTQGPPTNQTVDSGSADDILAPKQEDTAANNDPLDFLNSLGEPPK